MIQIRRTFPAMLSGILLVSTCAAAKPEDAARDLLARVLPGRADAFVFESIPGENGRDVFEVESSGGKTVLRGSNGVAMASALHFYLKNYCRASVSLCGSQLSLPEPLAPVEKRVRVVTPFKYRYCFNYCCFSYSMAWWDWPQWERAIDWMALEGINMPLAVTGQEAVWQAVYRAMGISDEAIGQFMVGPAYLPFGWMGCMDGWGGPLPQDWIDRHRDLEKKILERERALGMTPVLQGFTGHVPAALKERFPGAAFRQLPSWCGFPGTLFVDPQDPLFEKIGKSFIEEQQRQFGTDHLYAADTFIEMSPPSNDPAFLAHMARAVHGAMAAADPDAVWVMQGWLFVNNPGFWKPPQAEALLTAVPNDRMVVLDLYCESQPAWDKTASFYGKPWIWCIIQDFGNQVSLHGGLPRLVGNLNTAMNSPARGNLTGMGCIMEGLGYNPVVYGLMNDLFWQPSPIDLKAWIHRYAEVRYGQSVPKAIEAWDVFLDTVYGEPHQVGSAISARPALMPAGAWAANRRRFPATQLARAWQSLLECSPDLGNADTYRYDLVHVGREVLLGLVQRRKLEIQAAYDSKDKGRLARASQRYLELMNDVDTLLATRDEFLLGRWLEDAKAWAANDADRRLFEWNARNQITLWGPADSVLHDYASKQWAGLIRGFYAPRWEKFLNALSQSLETGQPFDAKAFEREIQHWEEAWTHQTETYPAHADGDPVAVARQMWDKYHDEIFQPEALSLTTSKPVTCSFALPTCPPETANDGFRYDTLQYWATDVSQDKECWWRVDLQQPTQVGRVVVVFYFADERSYGFTVEISTDGAAWDRVADYRDNLQKSTSDGVTCRFSPRPVRYIRVTITQNTANTGRHLVEVMAYQQ